MLALLGQTDRLANIDLFLTPQGLSRLHLRIQALDVGMFVLGQFTGTVEGPGDLQEAEAHKVGTQGNGQVDDPDRHLQVRGDLGGMGQVPDEGDAEGTDSTGKESPGKESEENELGSHRFLEIVDEHIDADMDAGPHAIGGAKLGHPDEHIDGEFLGPPHVDGKEGVVKAIPFPSCRQSEGVAMDNGSEDDQGCGPNEEGDKPFLQVVEDF